MKAILIALAAALALVAIAPAAFAEESGNETPESPALLSELGLASAPDTIGPMSLAASSNHEPFGECCKTCRKGKACGDSCIDRTENCEQPPGCACDWK